MMKSKSGKKLILWDLDGTLMHCGADGTKALNETFRKLYGVEDAFSKAGIGHAMDAVILDRIMENNKLDKNELEKVKREYIVILEGILGRNPNKRILPGVGELLEHINGSENCFSAMLTSNLRIGAETKLKSVGLDRYFHVGGFVDDYGEKWDAALKGIQEAEERFGVKFENENIYIIGDSIYDIECAKRIEVVSIGVATGWAEYEMLKNSEPDYLYEDLSDWKTLVQKHKWK
jgi:phosphoglycolate phosphatase-like HAD superfamily hydrolase